MHETLLKSQQFGGKYSLYASVTVTDCVLLMCSGGWSVIHAGRPHHYRNSRLEANIKVSCVALWTEVPFSSTLWKVSKNPTLIKTDWSTGRISTKQTNRAFARFTSSHLLAKTLRGVVPFFSFRMNSQVCYSNCIPTCNWLLSSQTVWFPAEMMSDPYVSRLLQQSHLMDKTDSTICSSAADVKIW